MKHAHLHTHSHYSLLDGLTQLDDMVQKAAADGQPALALTDHGVMYGAIEFYQKSKKAGIKPIIGIEGYLARDGMIIKDISREQRFHIILLAKDNVGYKNLIKITTSAHLRGYYFKPRIDFEYLKEHHEGLICLSGCLAGELSRAIQAGGVEAGIKVAEKYRDVFGDDYYLEVQHHPNLADQKIVNEGVYEIGKRLKIPIVATSDSHYLNIEDAEPHDILICLQTKKKMTDKDRMSFLGEDFSLHTSAQMSDFYRGNLEVLENTLAVAEKCNVEIELGKIQLPKYDVPEGDTPFSYLTKMCERGIGNRFSFDALKPETPEQQKTVERMRYELSVIEKTGYASYFLIVQDFINWAKDQGIVVGPGRGSAAGSLVAYVTNITDLDPLKYDLLFERFLNPDRISMPDIDTDFADIRRGEVLRYVENKYGKDHVSQIITFGTMAARAAVRDVGRVLDVPYSFCDKISKMIPPMMSLDNALSQNVELKDLYEANADAKRLIDYARKLEGVARHASTHACGVVISDKPIVEYAPTQFSTTGSEEDAVVSQYSLHPVEDLGLLKMDFLGLKNLTIIQRTCELIEKLHGEKVDVAQLPLDNVKTYELFQRGETTGVFQFESSGMKRYLRQLKPSIFEDLIAMVALYRPGPLNSGMVDEFIERKHGVKAVTYGHQIMEQSLKNTYGVIVYQEQVMQLSKDMAGFTGGQADTLRKAMGKKNAELMEKMKVDFIAGCEKNGLSKQLAIDTFTSMEKFAEYGFNKSHAACYALIAYQTAYLKANYSAAFMASLLSCDEDDLERIAIEIDECKKMGMVVLPPDVNESYTEFTVVADTLATDKPRIRFGLKGVKSIGEGIVKAIIHERKENGKFTTISDFLTRLHPKELNKKALEGLSKSGALDQLTERNMIVENMDKIQLFLKEREHERNQNQVSLFATSVNPVTATLKMNPVEPAPSTQRLSWEKQYLGLYVTDHPFAAYAEKLKDTITPMHKLKEVAAQAPFVIVAGVITEVKKILTSKGDPMLFVKLEDHLSAIELLIFPRLYADMQSLFVEERVIVAAGKLSEKDDEPKLLVDTAWEMTQANCDAVVQQATGYEPGTGGKWAKKKSIVVNYPAGASPELAVKVKQLFSKYSGQNALFLAVGTQLIKTNFKVKFCQQLITDAEALLGKGCISVK